MNFVSELWEQTHFFFEAPTSYDAKTVKKRWKSETYDQMRNLAVLVSEIYDFSVENTEITIKHWIAEGALNMGAIMNAFRLAIVGEGKGPHMFNIIHIIGKEETIARLNRAIETIEI